MKDINIENLKVSYSEKVVIKNMDMSFRLSKTTAIIGPNGCGKSTLLKAMGRIIPKDKGTILLDGQDIHQLPTKVLAQKLAILPQSPIAPEGLTVEELVSYGRFPHQKGLKKLSQRDREIIDHALCITNLMDLKDRIVDHMSGGQRQRVWIAMALAQETDILLLDEPTTYLDMAYQMEVLMLLDDLNKYHKTTIIMVLHDLNMASRFADYMVAMKEGAIIASDHSDKVMDARIINQVYDIDANIIRDPMTGRKVCLSYNLRSTQQKGA